MKTKRIVPVLVASLSLLAAACGSDDKADTTSPSAAPTDAPSDTDAPGTVAPVDTTGTTGDTGTTPPSDCVLDAPLKIGFAADLGELGAFSDQPGSEAAKVMVDKINEAGGVGGQQIEYEIKDIQGDPAATQRAAQELLDDGVNAIIGPPFASTGAPLLDTTNGKVPVVFMASTDPALADPDRGAFLASFSDPVQASAMAQFATEKGFTKAITFSSTDDVYFSGNPEYFKDAFEHDGGTVLQDFSFSLADTDFSTQVNEIAGLSDKPEVLFTAMVMPQVQTLLEQLDAADLGDIVVMGADSFDATVVKSAGAVADGVFFAAHTSEENEGVKSFLADASAAGANIETISFGALAADAVQIIVAAVNEACSVDGPTLITTINTLRNVPVTTGTVSYDGTGGVPEKDVSIIEIEGGELSLVEALRPDYIPAV